MKTIALIATLLLNFMSASLAAETQLGFYAKSARAAGKEDVAVAFETLEKAVATLTPEQRLLLTAQVENFRNRKMVKDAEFVASKLGTNPTTGVAAPTVTRTSEPAQIQLPNMTEPREIAHNNLEPGHEQEDPLSFNHRTALQYQVNQWTALAAAASDTPRKNAFTNYAAAYKAALVAYDGGTVSVEDQRTYGPALNNFEKEANRKGMLENARAIKIAIEKGKFLRTLEIASYTGDSTPTPPLAATPKTTSTPAAIPPPTPVTVAPEPPSPDAPAPRREPSAADIPPPTPVTVPLPPGRKFKNPAKTATEGK